MEKVYKCPKCGEEKNLRYNYDYSQQHRPIKDIICKVCGKLFSGDMSVEEYLYKYTKEKKLSVYLRTVEQIQEEMVEEVARKEFEKVGDEGLFPNHTDKDIWVSGFVAAIKYVKSTYPELEGTMNLCNDLIEKKTGKMTEEEWQAAEKAQTSIKTSIEWLVEQMQNNIHHTIRIPSEYVEQAKLLHKQEIIDTYTIGSYDMAEKEFRPEQYYQETFKKD
jgi:transcription elongation factor Elf1